MRVDREPVAQSHGRRHPVRPAELGRLWRQRPRASGKCRTWVVLRAQANASMRRLIRRQSQPPMTRGAGGMQHYNATKHPLCVKLGTISADGDADVYSYAEDDLVLDPLLSRVRMRLCLLHGKTEGQHHGRSRVDGRREDDGKGRGAAAARTAASGALWHQCHLDEQDRQDHGGARDRPESLARVQPPSGGWQNPSASARPRVRLLPALGRGHRALTGRTTVVSAGGRGRRAWARERADSA